MNVAPLGWYKTESVHWPTSSHGDLYTAYFIFKYKEDDDKKDDDTTVKPLPEPLTILGSITAAGFGVAFKRKKNSTKEE